VHIHAHPSGAAHRDQRAKPHLLVEGEDRTVADFARVHVLQSLVDDGGVVELGLEHLDLRA